MLTLSEMRAEGETYVFMAPPKFAECGGLVATIPVRVQGTQIWSMFIYVYIVSILGIVIVVWCICFILIWVLGPSGYLQASCRCVLAQATARSRNFFPGLLLRNLNLVTVIPKPYFFTIYLYLWQLK